MLAATFSRTRAADALRLPVTAIDALIAAGALRETNRLIAAVDIEALLRDTLLRLYRAEAKPEEVELELESMPEAPEMPPAAPEPEIMPYMTAVAEFSTGQAERPELRTVPRYKPRRTINGLFRDVRFNVLQVSVTGMRIRHDETLRPGDEARVSFAVTRAARTFGMQARVVWTSIAQREDAPSYCLSGLQIVGSQDQLRHALALLLTSREVEPEGETVKETQTGLSGLADEDVAAIIRARRVLSSDPFEANRWYTRGRFAMAEDEVRKAAPARAREREEVVALWEYLGRRVAIKTITHVVAWMRQTRAASAVATPSAEPDVSDNPPLPE